MKQKSKQLGFTFIELLVVVAIITLLSAIVLTALKTARIKARDARRAADVHQISNALAYVYDKYGSLPCRAFSNSKDDPNFMNFLSNERLVAGTIKDPLNDPNYYYHFLTFKSSPTAACGTGGGVIGFYLENPSATCPGSSIFASAGHCHLFFPNPFPAPCDSAPYYQNEISCLQLDDTVNFDP